jgi:SAM-dependent methyltransferase
MWEFDKSVAERFQHEAYAHIPDYKRVIDMCLEYVDDNYTKESKIIDVGSALGYTMHTFIQAGYSNISGVDSSKDMIDRSLYPTKIKHSSELPKTTYDVVLMNWTLHFINDKTNYLRNVYDNLSTSGSLILTDKTSQSPMMKRRYYDFKRKNGVSEEYITEKENMLKNYMNTMPIDWYINTLSSVGFSGIEILNAQYGFVTFVCLK